MLVAVPSSFGVPTCITTIPPVASVATAPQTGCTVVVAVIERIPLAILPEVAVVPVSITIARYIDWRDEYSRISVGVIGGESWDATP